MSATLPIRIEGLAATLPEKKVHFGDNTRYRISGEEDHLGLLISSAKKALDKAGLSIDDMDAIVGACAVGLQPIPCTAALVHEALQPKRPIPAFDVNSTCTSFVTALDVVSQYIYLGRFQRVLIISGDVPSIALNEEERHSFELFSDGAVSAIIGPSQAGEESQILFAHQMTLSEGAHMTEIVGGLTALPPYAYHPEIQSKYQFHMEGHRVLKKSVKVVEEMMVEILEKSGISLEDISMLVPHQASPALGLMMKKIGIPRDRYIDLVTDYGNMVSASIPFSLYKGVEGGQIQRGDTILLIGTAAGLTINAMILTY